MFMSSAFVVAMCIVGLALLALFLFKIVRRRRFFLGIEGIISSALPHISMIPHIEVEYDNGRIETISGSLTQPLEIPTFPKVIRVVSPPWPVDLNLNVTLDDSTQQAERYHFQEGSRPQLKHEIRLEKSIIEPYDRIHIFLNDWCSGAVVHVSADLIKKH